MTDLRAGRQPGTLICSDWGENTGVASSLEAIAQTNGRHYAVGRTGSQPTTDWTLNWETNRITRTGEADSSATPSLAEWQELLAAGAGRVCRSRGGARYVAGSGVIGRGHSRDTGAGNRDHGDHLGWFYWDIEDGANYKFRARQSRTWTATCKKVTRRAR